MDKWSGLPDLLSSFEYWSAVQTALADEGHLESAAPLYGHPYLDNGRLIIPRGPGMAEDSDGYTDYSIVEEPTLFSVRLSGRSRGAQIPETANAWFGTFDDVAKYFTARRVAAPTRSRVQPDRVESINTRWLDRSLAPGWDQVDEPDPGGFSPATRYFRSDQPERFYFTVNTDSATSFVLNLSWRELNSTFSEGLSGIERIPMPKFSDD
ncbi:hypothetical protein [Gordonia alkanivorans]|uniref:hypothetical protein n=1 Tax=Gordonia alkanivorans TaxID=84096 RepID=UPI00244B6404|nr:hypothetical protein [Gordonia alkanivorans]MDH3044300.1 hypothetical protein [Gordonia alkanivorans]